MCSSTINIEDQKEKVKDVHQINWLGPALNWGLVHILDSILGASGLYSAAVKKTKIKITINKSSSIM